ncbi:hypothetical protein Ahy_A06g030331 isoform C [Arachis hypogaea]|nr:hypothetical protein Ahy_A06g030331 isoform C [Arachis hypogaea]
MPLYLHCKYFLVPSLWISKWRNYVNPSVKNSDKPETLDGVIDSLKCEKHSRLVERPPELVFRRSAIVPRESSASGVTVISENDWKLLCEEWGGNEAKGISASIENIDESENVLIGSCEELPVCEDQLGSSDKVNNETENGQFVIKTCPEVCESCIGEKESCELMQKLNYCNENITVILVRGKEVVKENQLLQKGDKTIDIDDEYTTLADVNIFAGDQIIVRDSEIHENRDIAEELYDEKMDTQHTEEGFRGTLLTSNASSQAV